MTPGRNQPTYDSTSLLRRSFTLAAPVPKVNHEFGNRFAIHAGALGRGEVLGLDLKLDVGGEAGGFDLLGGEFGHGFTVFHSV